MDLNPIKNAGPQITSFEFSKDNKDILDLLEKSPMKVGDIELVYERSPDFTALLKCQSSRHETLVARGKHKEVLGFFSLSFSKKWFFGQRLNGAYIGDFRTNGSRQAAVLWRKVYAQLLQKFKWDSRFKVDYFVTGILKKNKEAIKNLVGLKKDHGFYYEFLKELNMVNVYGRIFPRRKKSTAIKATQSDKEALIEFLRLQEQKKFFGADFSGEEESEWQYRSETWPGFSVTQFLLIKDQQGQIKACTLPWDPTPVKRMRVKRAPAWLAGTFSALNFLGFHFPTVGSDLRTVYLTHLNSDETLDRSRVVQEFINFVFETDHDLTMVSFSEDTEKKVNLHHYFYQKVPVLLYRVRLHGDIPLQDKVNEVGFEMGLV